MQFQHLLCPVDFSEPSRRALDMAVDLAKSSGSALTLFHVYHLPIAPFGEVPVPPSMLEDLRVDAEKAIAQWRRDAESNGLARVTSKIATGAAWNEIVKWLNENPTCDLVVMGTHGRTGLKHALLGSVAEGDPARSLRRPRRPLSILTHRSARQERFAMLCGTDTSQPTRSSRCLPHDSDRLEAAIELVLIGPRF